LRELSRPIFRPEGSFSEFGLGLARRVWLNPGVFRSTRHHATGSQGSRYARWLGLLVLAAFALGVWLWWHHEHPKKIGRPPTSVKKRQRQTLVLTRQSPVDFPRPVHDVLEAQIALARRAISPGSIDGAIGSQTRAAIMVFQQTQNLPATGVLDTNTRAQLTLDAPVLTTYTVTTNDLAHLQPLGKTWLAKS
jgi:hypothetical protein